MIFLFFFGFMILTEVYFGSEDNLIIFTVTNLFQVYNLKYYFLRFC